MSLAHDLRSVAELCGDAAEQITGLMQSEAQLARAELSRKMVLVKTGAICLFLAGVFLVPTLVIFLISVALLLEQNGFSPVAGYFLAGTLGGVLSLAFALAGLKYLKPRNLTPAVTLHQLKRDVAIVKDLGK